MMPRRSDHKSVLLADLLPGLSGLDWARHQAVNSLALDSREVEEHGLWLALQGRGVPMRSSILTRPANVVPWR